MARKKKTVAVEQQVEQQVTVAVEQQVEPWLTDTIPARICRAAAKGGIAADKVAGHEDLLDAFDLRSVDCTAENVAEAKRIERAWTRYLEAKIDALNAARAAKRGEQAPTAVQPKDKQKPTAPATKREGAASRKSDRSNPRSADKPPKREQARGQVFGYSLTAVLRAMGRAGGWTTEAAAVAVTTLSGQSKLSNTTVRIQLKAGKDGQRGEPAPLTKAQFKQLKDAAK